MLIHARDVENGARLECDLCIVGAGAAGITVAREFARSDLRVCVLESGGLKLDKETQDLYDGESTGHPYDVRGSRLRYLGGTTNHWHGWCRPLDQIDFEPREGVPHSGWPLGRADLDAHYERAHAVCELGPYRYDLPFWSRRTKTRPFPRMRDVSTAMFQVSPPTRFGAAYRRELTESRAVRLLLNANVLALRLDDDSRQVTRADVGTLDGKRYTVEAREFVLATGGIENARLLLASNDVQRRGVGNQNDLVGRYFMDHPHALFGGTFLLPDRRAASAFYALHPNEKHPKSQAAVITSDRFVRSEGLLRFAAVLAPPPPNPSKLSEAVRAVARDIEGTDLAHRQLLYYRAEQAPNPDSRVTLGADRDKLGMPKVRLDWRITDRDRSSATRSVRAIAEGLAAAGLGRVQNDALVKADFWDFVAGGSHQMGTTRMHDSPRLGVVDRNCRVHGVSNLYVAGSSVFPTSGFTNPTLTIVALALRLADRLKGALS